jgi:hypothetical protein
LFGVAGQKRNVPLGSFGVEGLLPSKPVADGRGFFNLIISCCLKSILFFNVFQCFSMFFMSGRFGSTTLSTLPPHLRNLLGSCCGNGSPRSCRHRRDFNCFRLEIADRLQRKGQFSAALFAAGVELDGIGWCMLVYFTMQAQTFNPY